MKHILALLLSLLSLATHAAAGDAGTWITNVKLVSPERMDRVEQGSVLVKDGRIAEVRRGAGARKPHGAQVVDGKGYYLAPGLIDSHVHLFMVPGMGFEASREKSALAQAYFTQMPRSYLYFGYTTVVDLAVTDWSVIDAFNKAPLHPDLIHCGEAAVLANGYPMAYFPSPERFKVFPNFVYDPAQAASIPAEYKPGEHTPAAVVARAKASGAACVKTHFERGFGAQRKLPVISRGLFAGLRAETRRQGLALLTHANGLEGQAFAVDGGADVLVHGMWHWGAADNQPGLPEEVRSVLDKIVERRIGYQPTMQVLYGLGAYVDPSYLSNPAVRKVVPNAVADWYATPAGRWFKEEVTEGASDAEARKGLEQPLDRLRRVVSYLARRDANFLFGTDTPSSPTYGNLPGLNGYLEMQHLHEAGVSLPQLFKAATISNARAFGIDKQAGTIEPGKLANLVLMKKSPLQDIAAYDSIVTVWVRGQQVERAALEANRD